MRKYLISDGGQFYKANLHCHTVFSDGKMTPQEVKDYYKERGYSVIAFTDHCVLIPHPELNDENFIALNGYENEQLVKEDIHSTRRKCCHICYIALKKDNCTMPYFAPKSLWGKSKDLMDQVKFDYSHSFDTWGYGAEISNRNIKLARDAGFFVTYNHPSWSVERYQDYSQYTGMSAMEIYNYGSCVLGHPEYVPHIYDDLLLKGERIYAIASDDNHDVDSSCGGWTMIKAPVLEYEAITDALVRGDFYASFGPEIKELWYEDGRVHIRCSNAKMIRCVYGTHRAQCISGKDGKPVTEASFEVIPSDLYFRLTVIDFENRCADTNAYFTDDLPTE